MEMSTETYIYSYDENETYGEGPEVDRSWDENHYTDYTLAVVYILMFVFSLCANILVLAIIYLFEKLSTVTNLLLLNLVLSSFIFIISLPFQAVNLLLSHWPFGDFMCKLVGSFYYLGFYSSVLFLVLLTFDRYLAVVYSLSVHRLRSRAYALVSCAVVWILSALACIKPMMLRTSFSNQLSQRTFCQDDTDDRFPLLRSVNLYIQLLFFYLFPLLIVIYCYTCIVCTVLSSHIVTKFKTVRLIFIIVLLFFICWTPINIAMFMYENASTPDEVDRWQEVLKITQNFAHLYFCISPLFYTFVGKKFQNYFRLLLVTRFPRLKRHISVSQVSRTNMSTKSTPNEL